MTLLTIYDANSSLQKARERERVSEEMKDAAGAATARVLGQMRQLSVAP